MIILSLILLDIWTNKKWFIMLEQERKIGNGNDGLYNQLRWLWRFVIKVTFPGKCKCSLCKNGVFEGADMKTYSIFPLLSMHLTLLPVYGSYSPNQAHMSDLSQRGYVYSWSDLASDFKKEIWFLMGLVLHLMIQSSI